MHRVDFVGGYIDRFRLHSGIQKFMSMKLRLCVGDVGNYSVALSGKLTVGQTRKMLPSINHVVICAIDLWTKSLIGT
jgi:hypothetical protein